MKPYADKINHVQVMSASLKAYLDALQKRGIPQAQWKEFGIQATR